jgi:hypothetical protein
VINAFVRRNYQQDHEEKTMNNRRYLFAALSAACIAYAASGCDTNRTTANNTPATTDPNVGTYGTTNTGSSAVGTDMTSTNTITEPNTGTDRNMGNTGGAQTPPTSNPR